MSTASPMRRFLALIRALIAPALLAAPAAGAQTGVMSSTPGSGAVRGSVIDATSGAALAHATVTLSPIDGLGIFTDDRTGATSLTLARSTTTGVDGAYRFGGVAVGAYRLFVQRVGYAPATLDIHLGEAGISAVSVGLVVVPVRLRAVEVNASDNASAISPRLGAMPTPDRVEAARARQRQFISTDARELTASDITESATLGGSDVFRALQRLPGVTQFDDWSAKLWVRGNRWDESRVYYDGLPLFDPLQALGRSAGVSTDAIGSAFLHPGVRPVSLGGEGAARIDLLSRAAVGEGEWRGSSELSLFGLGGAVERERRDESGGFIVAARHSFGSLLGEHAAWIDPLTNDLQVSARADQALDGGRRIEASALVTRDGQLAGQRGFAEFQNWGNVAGRVTLLQPIGAWQLSHSLAATHFASTLEDAVVQLADGGYPFANATFSPVTSSVDYLTLAGRIARTPSAGQDWMAGYDLIAQRSSFGGSRLHLLWGDSSMDRVTRHDALTYASLWGDRRLTIGERLSIEAGLRADVGGSGLNGIRPAPALQARYSLDDRTSISAGAGRVHQYVQSIDLPSVSQGKPVPGVWLTSGSDVPAMSVDNFMLGLERWANGAVLLAANIYGRRTSGAVIADPAPGPLVNRPQFVSSTERALGAEVSARKLVGRVTGMLAYSYGRATTSSEGMTFPSSADRTHALDATSMVRLGRFHVGAGFSWTSGAPYTRTFVAGQLLDDSSRVATANLREAPNAVRAPNYSSLDLYADYTRAIHAASLSIFAGIQNATGRTNRTWFTVSGYCAGQYNAAACPRADLFEAPVSYKPTLGLRLRF